MTKLPSTLDKPSVSKMWLERFIRYMKVGAFLHLMSVICVAILLISARIALEYFSEGLYMGALLWSALSLWAFSVPFFSEFDAYGRFQNYKQIKDSLYEMGYDSRLIKPFIHSKCQRDAVIVAGDDLGHGEEVRSFFRDQGYRWYHILPDAFVKNPFVLFSGLFWKRILFTRHYALKNFYW